MAERSNGAHGNELRTALARGKWLVALAVAAFTAASLLVSLRRSPVFEARTTLKLDPAEATTVGSLIAAGTVSPVRAPLDDDLEVLRSRSLAEAVLSGARERGMELRLLDGMPEDRQARHLLEAVEVTPIRKSHLVEVRLRAPGAEESRDLANLFVGTYRDRDQQAARSAIAETKVFLNEQAQLVKARLEETEASLTDYRTETRAADVKQGTEAAVARLEEFRAEYKLVQAELYTDERLLSHYFRRLADRENSLAADLQAVSGDVVEGLRKDLSRLESARSQLLLVGVSPEHEKMKEIDARTAWIRRSIEDAVRDGAVSGWSLEDPLAESQEIRREISKLETEIIALRSRKEALNQVVGGYDEQLRDLPAVALRIARLERARAADEKILVMLTERLEEARIEEAGVLGRVTVVDPASLPQAPVAPRPVRDAAVGLLAGLAVGVAAALARFRWSDRIESAADIEVCTGTRVLGSLPHQDIPDEDDEGRGLILGPEGWRPGYEAYRRLASNLAFAAVDDEIKVLCVTSALPREGKSLTAANLSILLGSQDRRVLLVDADFHRPTQQRLLGIRMRPGLSDVIVGRWTLEGPIVRSGFANVDVLPCGAAVANPAELLSSRAMTAVMEEIRKRYDMVVIDAPPLLPINDALELAPKTDGVLLVARVDGTGRRALRAAMELVTRPPIRLLGVLANDVPESADPLYSGYYATHYAAGDRAA